MATTPNWQVYSPDDPNPYDPTTDMGVMATSVDTALTKVAKGANSYKGTSTERQAFLGQATEGDLWKDTNGTKKLYTKEGTAWVEPRPSGVPFAQSGGSVSVPPAPGGGISSTQVTFPAGRFTVAPMVQATAVTGAPGTVQEVSVTGSSPSGVTIHVARVSATATTVYWNAIQMTSSSGEG